FGSPAWMLPCCWTRQRPQTYLTSSSSPRTAAATTTKRWPRPAKRTTGIATLLRSCVFIPQFPSNNRIAFLELSAEQCRFSSVCNTQADAARLRLSGCLQHPDPALHLQGVLRVVDNT